MRLVRWRVLGLLLTRNVLSCFLAGGSKIFLGVAAILGLGAGLLLGSGAYRSPEAVLIVAVAFGACAAVFVADQWPRRFSWRCPVLKLDRHPRLRELVMDAARLAGVDTMPKAYVSAWAEVVGARSRTGRPALKVGLPLLLALNETELRTLLVRELLVSKRWAWHEMWAVHLFQAHHPDRPWLREVSEQLRKALWAEVRAIVGNERFLAGVGAELLVAGAFDWHVCRYAAPFARRGAALDVYESFQWKIETDGLLTRAQPISPAPDAAEAIGPDLDQPITVAPPGVLPEVPGKLGTRLGKVITHKLLGRGGLAPRARPYRMADLPAEEWAATGEFQRDLVLEAATRLLGRRASPLDVVDLAVAGRAKELDWWHNEQPCPHPTSGVCALMPVFDVALRRKGYVHEHPFAQRELVGPLGERVNLVELAAKAERGEPYEVVLEDR